MSLSTSKFARGAALGAALACLPAGCGFRFGPPPAPAVSVGRVESRSVEPGLRASLESALVTSLRRNGALKGPAMDLRIESMDQGAEAGVTGAGTVAFTASIRVHADVPDRPGCSFDVDGRRTWLQGPDSPIAPDASRGSAVDELADEVAQRIVAELIARPECQ